MAPIDGLIFEGYRSFDAGADDPFRIKWDVVRPSLELPAGAAVPALIMAAIGAVNWGINPGIVYTPGPNNGDALANPAQNFTSLSRQFEGYSVPKEPTL